MAELTMTYLKDGKEVTENLSTAISTKDTWEAKGLKIISYDGCKKIADHCNIVVKDAKLLCTPTGDNRQQHIWGLWLGYKGNKETDDWTFAEGEASQLNTGKLVHKDPKDKTLGMKHNEWGEVDSSYKSTMAYKRAYCKGVLRLCRIIGVYSDIEAKSFQNPDPEAVIDYTSL